MLVTEATYWAVGLDLVVNDRGPISVREEEPVRVLGHRPPTAAVRRLAMTIKFARKAAAGALVYCGACVGLDPVGVLTELAPSAAASRSRGREPEEARPAAPRSVRRSDPRHGRGPRVACSRAARRAGGLGCQLALHGAGSGGGRERYGARSRRRRHRLLAGKQKDLLSAAVGTRCAAAARGAANRARPILPAPSPSNGPAPTRSATRSASWGPRAFSGSRPICRSCVVYPPRRRASSLSPLFGSSRPRDSRCSRRSSDLARGRCQARARVAGHLVPASPPVTRLERRAHARGVLRDGLYTTRAARSSIGRRS